MDNRPEKQIKIEISSQPVYLMNNRAVVLFLFQDGSFVGDGASEIDLRLNGIISRYFRQGKIKGVCGEVVLIASEGKIPSSHVLLLGLGESSAFSNEKAQEVATRAFQTLIKMRISTFATFLPVMERCNSDYSHGVEKFFEGIASAILSEYHITETSLSILDGRRKEKEIILGLNSLKSTYGNKVSFLITSGEPENRFAQMN